MMVTSSIPLILKFADWPAEDRRRWERCLGRGSLFDVTGGAFSGWSAGTRRLHAQGYGSWLSFILRCYPALIDMPPVARASQDTIAAYIEEGQARLKPRSVANQIRSLAIVLRGFAPNVDFAWLLRAADNFYRQSGPQQLRAPPPIAAHDLFQWSIERLHELRKEAHPDKRRVATEFRQALNIGLLISCPVRARAFVAMTVSKHVDISEGRIMLTFQPHDMKDRRARRIPVPTALAPFLIDYLNIYRPLLLDSRVSDALWISRRGARLSQDTFTSGLARLTKRTFGVVLRPHAFRHIAATSIAIDDPAHAGIIRDVLGHATTRMAEMHYNRATAREASARLQDILREKRKVLRRKRSFVRCAGRERAIALASTTGEANEQR
jgi:integrase